MDLQDKNRNVSGDHKNGITYINSRDDKRYLICILKIKALSCWTYANAQIVEPKKLLGSLSVVRLQDYNI